MAHDGWITVPDVCRAMHVEPVPALTWSVGNAVREEYRRAHGNCPPKELRTKTKGTGSHCFAVYPPEMRPAIERLIREHGAEAERQGTLL